MVVFLLVVLMPFIFSVIGSILSIAASIVLHNDIRRKKEVYTHHYSYLLHW